MVEIKMFDGKWRWVVATREYMAGDVIEACPTIVITSEGDIIAIASTKLKKYVLAYNGALAVILGYWSLYNHSATPNAVTEQIMEDGHLVVYFLASERIKKWQEITIDYWGDLSFIPIE